MSESHVAVLDHTVQETNIWLKATAEQLYSDDRHQAYNALRAVLIGCGDVASRRVTRRAISRLAPQGRVYRLAA
jgi:uncharacterized protein (DUF2267 family)